VIAQSSSTEKRFGQPFIICTPTMHQKSWHTIGQRIADGDVSFEVKQIKNVKDVVPGWDDDDVDVRLA